MGFSMIFQPFPIAFLHSLGTTGRHSPDHARALAEADVLRRLNGGRGRTQCSRPFLGEMMRNHGMLKGLWLYAFFFSPSPSIFWTDFIFKGHLWHTMGFWLWDFDGFLWDFSRFNPGVLWLPSGNLSAMTSLARRFSIEAKLPNFQKTGWIEMTKKVYPLVI